MDSRSSRLSLPLSADLVLATLWLSLQIALVNVLFNPGLAFYPIIIALGAACVVFICQHWQAQLDFGWANRITLFRGFMIFALVAVAPSIGDSQNGNSLWAYVSLAVVALALDGLDGYVARATATESEFGARFDMELDALFILGLCVAILALDRAGAWVLALGLMRYGFVAASYLWPFLRAPLPQSFRRKTVCVWQLVTLMMAILPVTPTALALWSLALALVLLCYSFGKDILWLFQTRGRI